MCYTIVQCEKGKKEMRMVCMSMYCLLYKGYNKIMIVNMYAKNIFIWLCVYMWINVFVNKMVE